MVQKKLKEFHVSSLTHTLAAYVAVPSPTRRRRTDGAPVIDAVTSCRSVVAASAAQIDGAMSTAGQIRPTTIERDAFLLK